MGNNLPASATAQYGFFREDKPAKEGHSRELISRWNYETPDSVCSTEYNGCNTIWEIFQKTVKERPQNKFLGTRDAEYEGRPYKWKSYREVYDTVDLFARGIQALNLSPDTEGEGKIWQFFGIFAKNREEWAVADLACMRSSITIVPFYDSLGMEALSLVINLTNLTTMSIDKGSIPTLLKLKTDGKTPSLKNLVIFADSLTEDEKSQSASAGINIYTYGDLLEAGRKNPQVHLKEPSPDTIYMLCFTSGTTGDAKGAKETHSAFISNMYFFDNANFGFTEEDIIISYLPYAHVYEQCFLVKALCHGFSIGFYSGDPLKLLEDVVALQPTVFPTVPRILNRIHSKILEGVAAKGGFAQWLFNKAIREKQQTLLQTGQLTHTVYDRTVFKKIRDILGGRVRLISTGAAPINGDVLTFLKSAFSCALHEGYGQTEGLILTVTDRGDALGAGTVGGPCPNTKFRLRDIPEMNYLSTDSPYPRGELQYWGTTTFKGYYRNEERTSEAFSEDGWINTGDVAMVLPNGSIKIIDRAKNIFKLNQGEYVAPEKLENIYVQCSLIAQIFVHGDSLQNFLVAIVVPDPEVLAKWVVSYPKYAEDKKAMLESKELQKAVLDEMEAKAKEYKLSGIERVKKVHLTGQQFAVANDLVTPTFKLKRFNAKKFFQAQIEAMYTEGI